MTAVRRLEPLATEWAPRVLFERPEGMFVDVDGALVGLWLTSIRAEWLPGIRAALLEGYAAYSEPVPLVTVMRLDRRYPLPVTFDQSVREIREMFDATRHGMACNSVVVEFSGFLAATLQGAVRFLGLLSGRVPPFYFSATLVEALHRAEPHRSAGGDAVVFTRRAMQGFRFIEARLGPPGG